MSASASLQQPPLPFPAAPRRNFIRRCLTLSPTWRIHKFRGQPEDKRTPSPFPLAPQRWSENGHYDTAGIGKYHFTPAIRLGEPRRLAGRFGMVADSSLKDHGAYPRQLLPVRDSGSLRARRRSCSAGVAHPSALPEQA